MSWMPSEEWYEDLFDECKTKADVIKRATEMIKSRDRRIEDLEEKTNMQIKKALENPLSQMR